MEFSFDINYILPYGVTIFNGDYRVLNKGQATRIFASEKLTYVIDTMGEASYRAQGLPGAVTTARKFRISDHRLYIIKKANENNNLGTVIGILKVGTKHLYIYDTNGRVNERTPLCVLDFYVHESKQRLGYGRQLFDTMLEFEKCTPYELAIDRPSNKCLAFLNKHYHLSTPIHQVNNFVVYPAFFNQSPISLNRKPSASKQHTESISWLSPTSERQQRRPFSEQIDFSRNQKIKTLSNENDIFGNYPQPTTVRALSVKDEHQPLSYYTTSYNQHYNQTAFLREQTNTTHSASYIPRTYSQIFNENNPFLGLQRNNTTPIISTNDQSSLMNNYRRTTETIPHVSKPETHTSVYTFPSIMKSTNNWHQQQSTIGSSSSTWRLFGL
ncbi:unnamed protein product [Rotaria sp. Silwood1]|nr:unnamed protein product [Rotaria sp. Silwood1]CAF1264635.1 unnamed protein product [Rotaria sp. Silwood1]CAF3498145.1 unnamed protein product [Rotaria sp. Silwood1]CAF3509804.1 unnamed protein product [Rotaria sp. Silwood1]CAF4738983.1 unnamed protein product [Rotaria sp. Silwood1]